MLGAGRRRRLASRRAGARPAPARAAGGGSGGRPPSGSGRGDPGRGGARGPAATTVAKRAVGSGRVARGDAALHGQIVPRQRHLVNAARSRAAASGARPRRAPAMRDLAEAEGAVDGERLLARRRDGGEVGRDRPGVAAHGRPGQGRAGAQRPRVGERLGRQRAVDGQGARPRRGRSARPPRRRTSRSAVRPARGQDGGGVVGGLGARRQADRDARRARSPSRPAGRAAPSSPSIATVAPGRAARARSRSAKATSGWNDPALVPAARAGRQDRRRRGARWCGRSPGPSRGAASRPRRRARRRGRRGSPGGTRRGSPAASGKARAPGTSARNRSRRPASRLATAPTCQPARCEGDAEGRPDGAGADDPDHRAAVVGRARRAGGRGPRRWTSSPWRWAPGGSGSSPGGHLRGGPRPSSPGRPGAAAAGSLRQDRIVALHATLGATA